MEFNQIQANPWIQSDSVKVANIIGQTPSIVSTGIIEDIVLLDSDKDLRSSQELNELLKQVEELTGNSQSTSSGNNYALSLVNNNLVNLIGTGEATSSAPKINVPTVPDFVTPPSPPIIRGIPRLRYHMSTGDYPLPPEHIK